MSTATTTTTQAAPPATVMPTPAAGAHLHRLRWAVRATLTLGVAASVAANILHAHPNPISQIIAAWPPLALLLTVELISRVPTHRRSLAVIRLVATGGIAGIAAWVSYWHMAGVAARYGETGTASYLLPLSVDGLVIVASVSLVEISGRLRDNPPADGEAQRPTMTPPPRPAAQPGPDRAARPSPASPAPEPTVPPDDGQSAVPAPPADPVAPGPVPAPSPRSRPAAREDTAPDPPRQDTCAPDAATGRRRSHEHGRDAADGQAVIPTDTASAVRYWHQHDPCLHPAEIAKRIGRSERTVRRHWPATSPPTAAAHT
jgi:hypothetical protein